MWRSGVYRPPHMCHLYTELRIRVQHRNIWHLTPALHFVFFIFIFCLFIYLFIFESYLYHSVTQFQLQMIFLSEWYMYMTMCNDYLTLLNQVLDDSVSLSSQMFLQYWEKSIELPEHMRCCFVTDSSAGCGEHSILILYVVVHHDRQFCRLC